MAPGGKTGRGLWLWPRLGTATIWHLGRTCILLGAALLAAGSTLAESVTADGHEAASLAMSAVAALLIWMLPAAMRTTVARQELAA